MAKSREEKLKLLMEEFHSSIDVDRRLFRVDIQGSLAYARGLVRIGVLSQDEGAEIERALKEIEEEIDCGAYALTRDLEDIHMAVERRLIEKIGPTGGKLHTGRSRNDQIATDERLFLRDAVTNINNQLGNCQRALLSLAERTLNIIFPGYTHLQQAQPIRFAQYPLSIFFGLQRDKERLEDCRKRINVLPLGAGAMAGSAFPIDRIFLAQELEFDSITANSIDAVSDRDFIAEFLSACTILMVHVSRACEDLIIWSSTEFGYVKQHPRLATGSSIMPQKKNPDAAELLRGKTGRVAGNLVNLVTMLKGLPHAYNKDMQEDKEPLFDTVDTVLLSLNVFSAIWETVEIQEERGTESMDDTMLATDLADYLTQCGVPFREGHGIVASLVDEAQSRGCVLRDLPIALFQNHSKHFNNDVIKKLSFEVSADKRGLLGGTGKDSVLKQLEEARNIINCVC